MAITKTFNVAVPYLSGGKVVEWELGMTYTNSVSGQADFYESVFSSNIVSTAVDSEFGAFVPKKESSWTRAQLITLLSTISGGWDNVFNSQVESVITNPPETIEADDSYVIPD